MEERMTENIVQRIENRKDVCDTEHRAQSTTEKKETRNGYDAQRRERVRQAQAAQRKKRSNLFFSFLFLFSSFFFLLIIIIFLLLLLILLLLCFFVLFFVVFCGGLI